MSRNYKFHNPEGVYFVIFAVVEWLDVFTRNDYYPFSIRCILFGLLLDVTPMIWLYAFFSSKLSVLFVDNNADKRWSFSVFKQFCLLDKKLIFMV